MDQAKRAVSQAKADYGGLSGRQWGILIAENVGLSVAVAWLCYDMVLLAVLLFAPLSYLNGRRYRKKQAQEREQRFIGEYKEMLKNIVSALETGYSVENAFAEAQRQQELLFGEGSIVAEELRRINAAVRLRKPIEKAFAEFAERFPYEEVTSFADIFAFGKRLGGTYVENLRRTAVKLEERVALKEDIASTVAQKRLELSVMSVMPMGIIVYMRIGSPTFLAPLYHNMLGAVLMTGCIAVYVAALMLGRKVVDIAV